MLPKVRGEMARRGLNALVVTSADPHNSEYVADCFARRARLCGFCGTAGTCLVTQDKALLWTDGRYWLEAARTLLPEWELMKDRRGDPNNITLDKWIALNLPRDAVVGVDPATMTESQWGIVAKECNIVPTDGNVVDAADGPVVLPESPAEVFDEAFAGQSSSDKISAVAAGAKSRKADIVVITALDEVAWLFNLRGSDVPYNTLFYAFAVVHDTNTAALFIDAGKVTPAVAAHLPPGTVVKGYHELPSYLAAVASTRTQEGLSTVACLDPFQASHAVVLALKTAGWKINEGPSITQHLKGIKNPVELEGFRQCHVRDGYALTRFLAWLDDRIRSGHQETDAGVAAKLESLRAELPRYRRLSFETISGSGPLAAVIHRRCDPAEPEVIDPAALYLVDSGAHYADGTTDVTRTVTFTDTPAAREVEAYTLVLKGHIALNSIVFPARTAGVRIDAMARQFLWRLGLDYAHGTGHGVGHCLMVHEGPHGIGTQPVPHNACLDKAMIVSNEPGYYLDGGFGIRIENLEEIVTATTKYSTPGNDFLTMKTLTITPLCRGLIDVSLLTADELAWVNEYHARVAAELLPEFSKGAHELDSLAVAYVTKHCAPLRRE